LWPSTQLSFLLKCGSNFNEKVATKIFYTKKDGCVDLHIERESQVLQIIL
jgi:hypothetical protein